MKLKANLPGWLWWVLCAVVIGLLIWRPGRAQDNPWVGPVIYLEPGRILIGFHNTETLSHTTRAYRCDARCVAKVRALPVYLQQSTMRSPVDLSTTLEMAATQCDKMKLWARDEGARAPLMTRAFKIQQACGP